MKFSIVTLSVFCLLALYQPSTTFAKQFHGGDGNKDNALQGILKKFDFDFDDIESFVKDMKVPEECRGTLNELLEDLNESDGARLTTLVCGMSEDCFDAVSESIAKGVQNKIGKGENNKPMMPNFVEGIVKNAIKMVKAACDIDSFPEFPKFPEIEIPDIEVPAPNDDLQNEIFRSILEELEDGECKESIQSVFERLDENEEYEYEYEIGLGSGGSGSGIGDDEYEYEYEYESSDVSGVRRLRGPKLGHNCKESGLATCKQACPKGMIATEHCYSMVVAQSVETLCGCRTIMKPEFDLPTFEAPTFDFESLGSLFPGVDERIELVCTVPFGCLETFSTVGISKIVRKMNLGDGSEMIKSLRKALPKLRTLYDELCSNLDEENDLFEYEGKDDDIQDVMITFPGEEPVPIGDLNAKELHKLLKGFNGKMFSKAKQFFGWGAHRWNKEQMESIFNEFMQSEKFQGIFKKETVLSFSGCLEGLNYTTLGDIPSDVFKQTVEEFGRKEREWGKVQLNTLVEKAKTVFGDLGSWKGNQFSKVGSILVGIEPESLAKVQKKVLTSQLSVFGSLHGWSVEQASTLISTLKALSRRILKEDVKNKSNNNNGFGPNIEDWTSDNLKICGEIIKGFTPQDISRLANKALSGITYQGLVALNKYNELAEALEARLRSLSSEDASLFSKKQMKAMTEGQRLALASNENENDDSKNDNKILGMSMYMFVGLIAGVVCVSIGIALTARAVSKKKNNNRSLQRRSSRRLNTKEDKGEVVVATPVEYL